MSQPAQRDNEASSPQMSLLLSSSGAPLEPAGPHRKGELVAAVAKLTLGIELGMSNIDPSNVFGDVSAVAQAAGGLILGALVRKLDSVTCTTPYL